MSYKLLDGKDLAARMKKAMASEVETLTAEGIVPGLAVVIVGILPPESMLTAKRRIVPRWASNPLNTLYLRKLVKKSS